MSPWSIDLHPDVESDYDEAYSWYEIQQTGLGERFLKTVREKMQTIAQSPETYGHKGGKSYPEAKVDDFPYLIVYKVFPKMKRIFISAIHHEKLDPKKKYRA
jgi:hypothetical protein